MAEKHTIRATHPDGVNPFLCTRIVYRQATVPGLSELEEELYKPVNKLLSSEPLFSLAMICVAFGSSVLLFLYFTRKTTLFLMIALALDALVIIATFFYLKYQENGMSKILKTLQANNPDIICNTSVHTDRIATRFMSEYLIDIWVVSPASGKEDV